MLIHSLKAGRTGLGRILMGSVALNVAHPLPCSLITVKAAHAIRVGWEQPTVQCDEIEME
jgi:hypothetical protein